MIPNSDRRWLITALITSVIFLCVAVALVFADFAIVHGLGLVEVPGDLRRLFNLCEFFAHGFGVIAILLGIWILQPDWRKYIPRVFTAAMLPGLVVSGLKFCIARIRPNTFGQRIPETIAETWYGFFPGFSESVATEQTVRLSGYAIQSFPSGHTATAVGLALGLSWLMPRGKLYFATLATLASLQRIVSGAHWPSDVAAGVAIGLAVGGWVLYAKSAGRLFSIWEDRPTRGRRKYFLNAA